MPSDRINLRAGGQIASKNIDDVISKEDRDILNKPNGPVISDLSLKRHREIFLDAWWDQFETSFRIYHKLHKGKGVKMINDLEERDTRLFMEIWEYAELKARKLRDS